MHVFYRHTFTKVLSPGHFADHPLEDIIEKIACQFTARHIRGRPRPPYWYPGWPLYVCNSRYNDREHVFVRIKNWNSCVPEEVRKSAKFMPIYPFERTVFPRRVVSPFVSKTGKVKGPGGIEEGAETTLEPTEGDGNGRKRHRRTGTGVNAGGDYAGLPNKGGYAGAPVAGANALLSTFHHPYQPSHLSQQIQPHNRSQAGSDRSIISAAGGLVNLENHASIEKLPAETGKPMFWSVMYSTNGSLTLVFFLKQNILTATRRLMKYCGSQLPR
jgi:chromatin structure-remodeling complex subunit RSC1/2